MALGCTRAQLGADFRAFFTTIAVLLGAGVLGLPVKLVYCGYGPFMVVMTVVLLMQVATVYIQLDSLVRAQAALIAHRNNVRAKLIAGGGAAAGTESATLPAPDLHTMGKMFLTRSASAGMDGGVLFMFVTIMITYGLAGSDAFAGFTGLSREAMITPFMGACTAAILLLEPIVKVLVSVLTSAKVTLLIFIIGTIGVVAHSVGVKPHEDYHFLMEPFLVGTVAIGGISTMMPVLFPAQNPTKSALAHFKWSVIAGVAACYALNAFWALFVLGIVPQTEADAAADNVSVSLEQAADNGDIATAPVIKIINASYPWYNWVATSVQAFIAISITVSFNAVGLGLKSLLTGLSATGARYLCSNRNGRRTHCCSVDHKELEAAIHDVADEPVDADVSGTELSGMETPVIQNSPAQQRVIAAKEKLLSITERAANPEGVMTRLQTRACGRLNSILRSRAAKALLASQASTYVCVFGAVWAIALADPSGFLTVLEVFTSMTLNMSGGVFVAMIAAGARFTEAVVHAKAAERSGAGDQVPFLGDAEAGDANEEHTSDGSQQLKVGGSAHVAVPVISTSTARAIVYFCLVTYSVAVFYDVYTAAQRVVNDESAAILVTVVALLIWRFVLWPIGPWLLGASKPTMVRWWRFQTPKRSELRKHTPTLVQWVDHWALYRALLFGFSVVTANAGSLPPYATLGVLLAQCIVDIATDMHVYVSVCAGRDTGSASTRAPALASQAAVTAALAGLALSQGVYVAAAVQIAMLVWCALHGYALHRGAGHASPA